MNELQIAKEVFLSIIKWFLIVIILNNLIWGGVFWYTVSSTSIDMEQDGHDNIQELTNG